MPSVSAKQARFMQAVAHDSGFAKKVGVSQSVGRDFAKADNAAGITKNPDRRTKGHRAAVSRGAVHPRSHSEFERLGK